MRDLIKYHGVIPAFYACYDDDGGVSPGRTRALAGHLIGKGVKGRGHWVDASALQELTHGARVQLRTAPTELLRRAVRLAEDVVGN